MAIAVQEEATPQESGTGTGSGGHRRFGPVRPFLPDLGVLGIYSLLVLWAVRPLLEEWGIIDILQRLGLSALPVFFEPAPLRPGQFVPTILAWTLARDRYWGVALSVALIGIARYCVARWAVSPICRGYTRWAVASLALFLPPWSAGFFVRFQPAALSAVFFFIVLGATIRLSSQWQIRWLALGALGVFATMATYGALVLGLAALPLLALFWPDEQRTGRPTLRAATWRASRAAAPLALGFLVYGLYAIVVTRLYGAGYEGQLAQGSEQIWTPAGAARHTTTIVDTAFRQQSWVLPMLILLMGVMVTGAVARRSRHHQAVAGVALLAAVVALPAFAFVFTLPVHASDYERVLFPISVIFVVLMTTAIGVLYAPEDFRKLLLGPVALVVAILLLSANNAAHARALFDRQATVIGQTTAQLTVAPSQRVLLRDSTGLLGDTYSLYGPDFGAALRLRGVPVDSAVICTPLGTDRRHSAADRIGIPTTERCETLAVQDQTLVLDVRAEGSGLVITPAP